MKKWLAMTAYMTMLSSVAAQAQEAGIAPAAPPPPALEAPAAPAIAAAPVAEAQADFPKLPASLPCKKEQLYGVWKMVDIHEKPKGFESQEFITQPFQFLHLSKDTTYRIVKRDKPTRGRRAFNAQFKRKPEDPMQQWVLHEKGFLYLYNEGNVVDTQACFIVASDSGEFVKGQMLLMPPAPAAGQPVTKRLLKVYNQIVPGPKKRNNKK